jgi:putative membrane protein
MYGHMGYGWTDGWMGTLGFGLHGVGMLVFWGLLIWGAIVLFRVTTRGTGASRRGDAALDVVKERFARGELSREQFNEMREALR